jgi:predicted nuclease with TOPRIM domain
MSNDRSLRTQLNQRLQQLKAEHSSGQELLRELEMKQASLRETLLRINGAIQVLEEELSKAEEFFPETDAALPADHLGS